MLNLCCSASSCRFSSIGFMSVIRMKCVLLPPQVLWRITNPHINSGTLQTQMVQVKYYAYVHIMLIVYLYSTVEAVPCQVLTLVFLWLLCVQSCSLLPYHDPQKRPHPGSSIVFSLIHQSQQLQHQVFLVAFPLFLPTKLGLELVTVTVV